MPCVGSVWSAGGGDGGGRFGGGGLRVLRLRETFRSRYRVYPKGPSRLGGWTGPDGRIKSKRDCGPVCGSDVRSVDDHQCGWGYVGPGGVRVRWTGCPQRCPGSYLVRTPDSRRRVQRTSPLWGVVTQTSTLSVSHGLHDRRSSHPPGRHGVRLGHEVRSLR